MSKLTPLHMMVFGGAILFSFVTFLSWQWRGWNFDDAYIVYRIVSNLVAGNGWAFNPGEIHNASTSVLNTVLIALLNMSGMSVPASGHVLGGASVFFASFLVYRYLFITYRFPVLALLGGGFVAWRMATNATWGLEINLFIALVLAVCTLRQTGIRWMFVGIAVLARPDAMLLGLCLLLADIIKYRRPQVRAMLIAAVLVLPWVIYSLAVFHQLFPDTLTNKMWQGRSGYWGEGLIYLKGFLSRYAVWNSWYWCVSMLAAAAGMILSYRRRRILLVLVLFVVSQQVIYVFLNIPPQRWYMVLPEIAVIFLSFVFVSEVMTRICAQRTHAPNEPGLRANRVLLARYGLLAAGVLVWGMSHVDSRHINARDHEYASVIKAIDGAYGAGDLAVSEVGGVGYYSGRKIVDIVGLTSSEGQFVTVDRMDRFYEISPQFLLFHDPVWGFEFSIFNDPRFEKTYQRVQRFPNPFMSMQLFEKKPEAITRSRLQ